MLDDKDEFTPPAAELLTVVGRIAVANIIRYAATVTRRQATMPERFEEDCTWLKGTIMAWHTHIDAELRFRGLLEAS